MPRRLRVDVGRMAYRVLNRGVGRRTIFEKGEDYAAFEKVLDEAYQKVSMRVAAYCLMPNHWHLVHWPRRDGQLSRYMQWLTSTHLRRWHSVHGTRGSGPLLSGTRQELPGPRTCIFWRCAATWNETPCGPT